MSHEKLGKLVPLLGSDKDGEVVSAARAIGRMLKSIGKDWHDLATAASLLGEKAAANNNTSFARAAAQAASGFSRAEPTFHAGVATEGELLMVRILYEQHYRKLGSERAKDFIVTLRDKTNRGERVVLTNKQRKWLNDLYEACK